MPPPKADEGFFCIVVPFVWGSKSSSSFMQGGCACGRTKGHENKRSLRSPFGNLRRTPMLIDWYWRFSFLGVCFSIRTEGSSDKHAGIVCSRHQLNRADGSREELPCRVKGQSPLRSPEAEPLAPPLTSAPHLLSWLRIAPSKSDSGGVSRRPSRR